MITQDLVDFIKRYQAIGVSWTTLIKVLRNYGWNESDLAEAQDALLVEERSLANDNSLLKSSGVDTDIEEGVANNSTPNQTVLPSSLETGQSQSNNQATTADIDLSSVQYQPSVFRPAPVLGQTFGEGNMSNPSFDIGNKVPASQVNSEAFVELTKPAFSANPNPPNASLNSDPSPKVPTSALGNYNNQPASLVGQGSVPKQINQQAQDFQSSNSSQVFVSNDLKVDSVNQVSRDPYQEPIENKTPLEVNTFPHTAGYSNTLSNNSVNASNVNNVMSGMSVTQAQAETIPNTNGQVLKAKKSRRWIWVVISLLLLLVVGVFVYFSGLVDFSKFSLFGNSPSRVLSSLSTTWQGDQSFKAVSYQLAFDMNNTSRAGDTLSVNIEGQMEFFDPENKLGKLTFSAQNNNENLSGDIHYRGKEIMFRPTQASNNVSLFGLNMSSYAGDWFLFSTPVLKEKGYLLFENNEARSGDLAVNFDFISSLKTWLNEVSLLDVVKDPSTNSEQGTLSLLISPPVVPTKALLGQMLLGLDYYLGASLDQPNVKAILDSIEPEPLSVLVNTESSTASRLSLPFSALGELGQVYDGNLVINLSNYNMPVDLNTEPVNLVTLEEYVSMGNSNQGERIMINGDQLLTAVSEQSFFMRVVDRLSKAGQSALRFGLENNGYVGVCEDVAVNQAMADVGLVAGQITADCRSSQNSFILLAETQSGFFCTDATQLTNRLESRPAGLSCEANLDTSDGMSPVLDLDSEGFIKDTNTEEEPLENLDALVESDEGTEPSGFELVNPVLELNDSL